MKTLPVTALLLLLLALGACRSDDPLRIYGGPDLVWHLKELGNAPFSAQATLSFPKSGEIAGQGPCNSYFGAVAGIYPAFDAGPIGSTRIACPELAAESAYLAALEAATTAEVTKEQLILTGPDGIKLLFKTRD
jgi:heat shock protein HslJ